jgi:hypothetical protein
MRDALRTCLQIAGGVTEATRRRTVEAARDLLDQAGIDVDAVQRRIGSAIPPEVQALADELMATGRANRDLLLGLVREEVDKAMSRVGRIADEVTKVGVVLETLERRIRNLEGAGTPPPEPAPTPRPEPAPPVQHVVVEEPGPAAAKKARPAARKTAAVKKATTARSAAANRTTAAKKTAAKAPAKKAAVKKAPAKRTTANPSRTTAPGDTKAGATPAAAKKAAQQTVAKRTAAKKAAAGTAGAEKTAAKKTAARKTAAKKTAPAKKAAPPEGKADD